MGRFIVKLTDDNTSNDYYLEWSTIVDAPVTYGMRLWDFEKYYNEEYGRNNILTTRLERVEVKGTSSHIYDLEDLIVLNRAGEDGGNLNKEQLIQKYCINAPK